MTTLVTILHVLVCLFLMLTVLLQSGKAGMGAAFGGAGSQTVFGGSGASSLLRKVTVIAAAIFMLTSMMLAWMATNQSSDALQRFSAQQRRAAELKEAARQEALGGSTADPATAPEGTTDGAQDEGATMPGDDAEGVIDDGAEGVIDDGAEGDGADTAGDGAEGAGADTAGDGAAGDSAGAEPAGSDAPGTPDSAGAAPAPAAGGTPAPAGGTAPTP